MLRIQVERSTGNQRGHMLVLVKLKPTGSCLLKMIWYDKKKGCTTLSRHFFLLCIQTGLHGRSHLLSDRCRKSLMASASLPQVGGHSERRAKAKNFTVSSDAGGADRKMRMTPPRSFSSSPCDARSRCTSRACTTRRLTVTGSFLRVGDLNRCMEHAGKTVFTVFHIGIDNVRGTQLYLTMRVEKDL